MVTVFLWIDRCRPHFNLITSDRKPVLKLSFERVLTVNTLCMELQVIHRPNRCQVIHRFMDRPYAGFSTRLRQALPEESEPQAEDEKE
ncbi:hypothetical protein L686_21095 [Stutzerimonas stutzeri MF28]|uniref:Uncharacterized protein n=1 Tax=Stutzerimonas stutzeri TaxID=316 RepID=A0A2N8SRZ0_STUST|nr:hypothetical protein L686_21095 [Stutzerimonas stutzeri MF28]PNG05243.1 hypothetical protein CXL00_10960 [Stutzerimonas stutzeri]